MRILLALLALVLAWPAAGAAQDVPPILIRGLEAYQAGGYQAGMDAWLEGWGEKDRQPFESQFIPLFQQLEIQAGEYTGYEILGMVRWGERSRRVYLLMFYEERPLYCRFDLYQSGGAWRVMNITVNTDPQQIFPSEMLSPPAYTGASGG